MVEKIKNTNKAFEKIKTAKNIVRKILSSKINTASDQSYKVWDSENLVMQPLDISDSSELDSFLDTLYDDLYAINPEYAEYLSGTVFGTPVDQPLGDEVVIEKITARDWYKRVMDRAKALEDDSAEY